MSTFMFLHAISKTRSDKGRTARRSYVPGIQREGKGGGGRVERRGGWRGGGEDAVMT
jgi:hypothetical protein